MGKLNHIFEKHGDFFKDQQEEIGKLLRSTMKFYYKDGRAYPSVTSIINPTGMSFYAREYAARGTIAHHIFRHWIETREWLDWYDCSILEKEIYIIETGRNKLKVEDANCKGFINAFGDRFYFDKATLEKRFFNEEHGYTGRPDVQGVYGLSVPVVPDNEAHWAMIDLKSVGAYDQKGLEKIFMQLAAYAFGIGEEFFWGICIPLNGKTKLGYAEPIVCNDLRPYFEKFMQRRKALEDLYGI